MHLLSRASSGFAGIVAAACSLMCFLAMLAAAAEPIPDRQVIHVLNRLAFGPTLDEFRQVKTIGIERYIAEQLDPDSIAEPIELRWRLAQLDTLKLNPVQLRQLYGPLRILAIFWMKPRGGWSETSTHKHTGVANGDPIEVEVG